MQNAPTAFPGCRSSTGEPQELSPAGLGSVRLRLPPHARGAGLNQGSGHDRRRNSVWNGDSRHISQMPSPCSVPRVCFKLIASLLHQEKKKSIKVIQCEITVICSQNKFILNWLGESVIWKRGRNAVGFGFFFSENFPLTISASKVFIHINFINEDLLFKCQGDLKFRVNYEACVSCQVMGQMHLWKTAKRAYGFEFFYND